MADNGRWWKLWIGADEDPDLGNLSNEDFGRWCKFGLYVKKHGTGGVITLNPPCKILQQKFEVSSFEEIITTLKRFPNCLISTGQISWPHGRGRDPETDGVWTWVSAGYAQRISVVEVGENVTGVTVTFSNWYKYQEDSSTERVRKYRESVTPKKRREEKRINTPTPLLEFQNKFGPNELIDLYNSSVPPECSQVTSRSPARKKKASQYLAVFPKREFWEQVFQRVHESTFLRGLSPPGQGHSNFKFDFDWMLTKGKDGSENAVKVFEGKYSDQKPANQERKFVG